MNGGGYNQYFKARKGKLDIMISDDEMKGGGLSAFGNKGISLSGCLNNEMEEDEMLYKTPGDE